MNETDCCPEYAAMSRRGLLKGALAFGASTTVFGTAVVTASPASAAPAPAVLVVVSLRGACDGLSLVVPHADPGVLRRAAQHRHRLRRAAGQGRHVRPAPGVRAAAAVLDRRQGGGRARHRPPRTRTARTSPRWRRSRTPTPGSSVRSGWLNRLVGTDADANPLQGLAMGSGVAPASLYGPQPVMSAGSVERPRRGRRRRRRVGLPPDELAAHALGRQHLDARPLDEVDLRGTRVVPDRQGQPRRARRGRRVPRQRPRPGAEGGLTRRQERRRRRRAHRRPGRLGPPHRHGQRGRWPAGEQRRRSRRTPWRPSSPTSARGPTRSPSSPSASSAGACRRTPAAAPTTATGT